MRAATSLAAPAHLDAEVLSALGRPARNGTADAASAAVACAEILEATLLTLDGRLARSAPVPVEPLA